MITNKINYFIIHIRKNNYNKAENSQQSRFNPFIYYDT